MKRVFQLVLIFMIATGLSACSMTKPKVPGKPERAVPSNEQDVLSQDITENATVDLAKVLENSKELGPTPEFVTLFFNYYHRPEHSKELRLLPSFAEGTVPPWDELSHFAFSMAEKTQEEGDITAVKIASFEEVVDRFLPEFDYVHGDSGFVRLCGDRYIATGWSDDGGNYYRLTALSRDSQGIYSASFDGFCIKEGDYLDSEPTGNMKAVKDKAEKLGLDVNISDPRKIYKDVMLKLFLDKDYPGPLVINETVEIRFKLSQDTDYPFVYISCARTLFEGSNWLYAE